MKKLLSTKAYYPFYLLYTLFLTLGGIFLLTVNREESHLILNRFFYPELHSFFIVITYLGDGIVPVILVILALFINYKSALQLAIASICAGGSTQLLKNFVFDDVDRPSWFFKHFSENSIQLIEGIHQNIHNSFPSGHTTTAFAVYVSALLLLQNRTASFILILTALVAGYSRVYLSQHFFVDIYFGSIMGTVWAVIIYSLLSRKNYSFYSKSLLNR